MKKEEYSINPKEQEQFNHKILPTTRKIKIIDDDDLRYQIEMALENLTQKQLALYVLENAKKYFDLIDVSNKEEIILSTTTIFIECLEDKCNVYTLRQAGFLAGTLAKNSQSEISQIASRIYQHALSSLHMRAHAIVSLDYTIKLINILSPGLEEAIKVRRSQLEELKKTV